MAGAGVEVICEDAFVGSVQCDDALAKVGEEVGAVVRDVDDGVGGAVDDEGVAAACSEGEEDGWTVAEEGERAVGDRDGSPVSSATLAATWRAPSAVSRSTCDRTACHRGSTR